MSERKIVIMKCYVGILSLFITVSSAQDQSRNDHNSRNTNVFNNNRNTESTRREILKLAYEQSKVEAQRVPGQSKQEDKWFWGYAVDTKPASKPNVPDNSDRTHDKIKDPCTPYDPPKPKFSALGRRICEIKCYEYIWELNTRHESNLRSEECMRELENSDPNYIPPLGIIRGRITEPGEFPHMGAIGWQAATGTWVFKCGSSLISSKFVLTAGHCSRASDRDTTIADPVPKIIRLGDKNIIDVYANGVVPTDAKIINIIVHPKFNSKFKFNFGRTTSPQLQTAVVDLIDTTVCDQLLKPSCNRNWCGVKDDQICAGKLAGGVDACQGDSGGPLQVQISLPITTEGSMHYIVGVTSFGVGCALPNLPGIYSRVSMYLDWIESVVWR